jgi:hypothetical protein
MVATIHQEQPTGKLAPPPRMIDELSGQVGKLAPAVVNEYVRDFPAHPDKCFARSSDVLVAALEFEHVRA